MTQNLREDQPGAGFAVDIAADAALSPALTAAVVAAAARAEDAAARPGTCVTVRIRGTRAGARFDWPGAVTVGDVG